MRTKPNTAIYISVGITLVPFLIELVGAVVYVVIQVGVCGVGYAEDNPAEITFIDMSFFTS